MVQVTDRRRARAIPPETADAANERIRAFIQGLKLAKSKAEKDDLLEALGKTEIRDVTDQECRLFVALHSMGKNSTDALMRLSTEKELNFAAGMAENPKVRCGAVHLLAMRMRYGQLKEPQSFMTIIYSTDIIIMAISDALQYLADLEERGILEFIAADQSLPAYTRRNAALALIGRFRMHNKTAFAIAYATDETAWPKSDIFLLPTERAMLKRLSTKEPSA